MKLFNKLGLVAVSTLAAAPAFAQEAALGNDYTSMTNKIDSKEIAVAVITAGGVMLSPWLALRGVRFIKRVI